jgi:hypothetical protein
MHLLRRSSPRLLAPALALVAVFGCGGSDDPVSVSPVPTGTYTATTFQVTPDGQSAINVLSQGGTLTVTLSGTNSVSGQLRLPASIAGTELVANWTGTAVVTGNTVVFPQGVDTFVRDLTWTVGTNTISVTNQRAGAATFTITLTRQ